MVEVNEITYVKPIKKTSVRYPTIDVIRGIAVLGILLINANYFSTITIERYNPLSHGEFTGLNYWIWALEMVFVKQRFMTVFSILFGAGVFLMVQSNINKGLNATQLHIKRMLWLVGIGAVHGYLVWDGDILVSYAFCGLVMYVFKNLSIKWLYVVATLFLLIPFRYTIQDIQNPPEITEEVHQFWFPKQEVLEQKKNANMGSWLEETPKRASVTFRRQTSDFISWTLWRVGGLFLIGIALIKSKFLTGERPLYIYVHTFWYSFLLSVPISCLGVYHYVMSNFNYTIFATSYSAVLYLASISMAFMYISGIIILVKKQIFQQALTQFERIGKIALSNYILQSILGTLIYFGYGFGFYGRVDRTFVVLSVVGIWAVNIVFTNYWLKRNKQGPLEYIWRTLTYGKS